MSGALKINMANIKPNARSKAVIFFMQNTPYLAFCLIIYEAIFSVKAIVRFFSF